MNCSGKAEYYTCSSNGFKGCCSVNPCGLANCPDSNETFESNSSAAPASQSQSKSQEASSEATSSTTVTTGIPTSLVQSSFLTLATTTTVQSLVLTSLANNPTAASSQSSTQVLLGTSSAKFSSTLSTSSIVSSTPISTAIPATRASSSAFGGSTSLACPHSCSSKPEMALIGGVVAGGVAALLCLAVVLLWCRKKRKVLKDPLNEESFVKTDHQVASQSNIPTLSSEDE
ncbi:MAG: hypothetical protein M1812_001620 [Candelaria pacifica]|nr:MAG: hypothetical protein M1812_001620 [Candelaria pacifica]